MSDSCCLERCFQKKAADLHSYSAYSHDTSIFLIKAVGGLGGIKLCCRNTAHSQKPATFSVSEHRMVCEQGVYRERDRWKTGMVLSRALATIKAEQFLFKLAPDCPTSLIAPFSICLKCHGVHALFIGRLRKMWDFFFYFLFFRKVLTKFKYFIGQGNIAISYRWVKIMSSVIIGGELC